MLIAKNFNNLTIKVFEPINSTLKMQTNIKFGYKQSAGYFVSKNGGEEAEFILGDKLLKYKNKNIFIKIDTEAHELFVIKGIDKLILNNNIILQVEIWNNNFTSTNILLEKYGFIYFKKINSDYDYSKFKNH